MTRTWAVNDKAKLFDYSGRHGDIGRVDYIGNGVVLLDLGDCIWPVDPSDLKPVATIAEMAAERDPLYAAMQTAGEFRSLKTLDYCMYITASKKRRRWYQLRRNKLTCEIQDRVKRRNDDR